MTNLTYLAQQLDTMTQSYVLLLIKIVAISTAVAVGLAIFRRISRG